MAEVNVEDFKPNSNKYKAEHETEKKSNGKERVKVDPIIKKDSIVSTKKPFGKKMFNLFIGESLSDMRDYIINECIIPGIQDAILNTLSMAFRGETYHRSSSYDRNHTPYSSFYRGRKSESEKKRDREHGRDRYEEDEKIDYRHIVLKNRKEAEDLVDYMKNRIYDTGSISVAEFLDMMELPSRWTDNDWGWKDERDIYVKSIRDGFLIDVPERQR